MNLKWYEKLEWSQRTNKIKRVIFVCSGNATRSVAAEYFFNNNNHIHWWTGLHATSRGVNVNKIRAKLRRRGIDPKWVMVEPEAIKVIGVKLSSELANRTSKNITKRDIHHSSLVLTMERYMRDELRATYPEFAYKIFTLRGFVDESDNRNVNLDFKDPFVNYGERPPGGPEGGPNPVPEGQPWSKEYQWWYRNFLKEHIRILGETQQYVDELVNILHVLKGALRQP